jgi:hypothetical protein
MNIIKEFSEFKGPKDSVQWKIEISSHATTDLTIELRICKIEKI